MHLTLNTLGIARLFVFGSNAPMIVVLLRLFVLGKAVLSQAPGKPLCSSLDETCVVVAQPAVPLVPPRDQPS